MLKLMMCWGLTALLAMNFAGCKKAEEKATEKMIEKAMEQNGGKADVDLAEGKMSMKTDKGEQIEVNGDNIAMKNEKGDTMVMGSEEKGIKMPEDFPKNIYVYEGATVFGSMKSEDGHALMMNTADPMEKVADAYKAKMKAGGWKEKTVMSSAEMHMLEYALGTQGVVITINPNSDSKTQIVLQARTIESEPTPAAEATPQ